MLNTETHHKNKWKSKSLSDLSFEQIWLFNQISIEFAPSQPGSCDMIGLPQDLLSFDQVAPLLVWKSSCFGNESYSRWALVASLLVWESSCFGKESYSRLRNPPANRQSLHPRHSGGKITSLRGIFWFFFAENRALGWMWALVLVLTATLEPPWFNFGPEGGKTPKHRPCGV